MAMCCALAGPTLAFDSSPGLARAASNSSVSVLWGDALLTTMTCGELARSQTGSKLVSGS
jgi:hypothetical protein